AEARQRRGPHRRILFRRKHRGTLAPIRDVDAPEPQPFAVPRHEMAIGDAHNAVVPGGRVKQKREINHRCRASTMIQRKRFHFAIHLGWQKGDGDEENQENGAHSSLLSLLLGILISPRIDTDAADIIGNGQCSYPYLTPLPFLRPAFLMNGRNSSNRELLW